MSKVHNFDLVLFGGTGDLVTRKLIPALYSAYFHGNLPNNSRIIALGRKSLTKEEYCQYALDKAKLAKVDVDKKQWDKFSKLLDYQTLDAGNLADFESLKSYVDTTINNIFYLSTAPNLFKPICENLAKVGLNHDKSRLVLEKPLGHDLKTATDINDFVATFFKEDQIFRIDHYLGKESVQNLMAIRFGNTLFEALWRRQWISSIQITIAENLGVGTRGD
ncbi:MAG TPA: glucose-6-phosphate dehydrogenase, partial [Aquella sp.]|nr:glucose-6-phosphate dehydrogenase [Aquella sp.]